MTDINDPISVDGEQPIHEQYRVKYSIDSRMNKVHQEFVEQDARTEVIKSATASLMFTDCTGKPPRKKLLPTQVEMTLVKTREWIQMGSDGRWEYTLTVTLRGINRP